MSHYHLEIVMPPTEDVNAAIAAIMQPFSERNDEPNHAFWDYWVIGGRYSGSKLEANVGEEKIDAFREELIKREVTISNLTFGKAELSPASQIPEVDALWREMCPGAGDVCPLFAHAGDRMQGDICTVADIPKELRAFTFIYAEFLESCGWMAKTLWHKDIWNGVSFQSSQWSGNVLEAIAAVRHSEIAPDWLCVTVDYHS